MMRRVLIFALVLLAVLWAFSQYLRRTSMFFPSREGNYDPRAYKVQPEDVWFTSADGVKLHGWLFRGRTDEMVIWFHGNGGNITDRGAIAAELASRGVSVFVFDWRGYGKSGGTPNEHALFEDAIAAYDLFKKEAVLYGESLGGPYAAYVAKNRKAKAVIIENSFPSLAAMGNKLYGLGWLAPRALRTTDWLNDANVPVLVMHGKRDQVIPFALGMRLYDGLKVQKQLLTSETAGHCEIPAVEPERYYEAVMGMCRTSIGR